ncbi:MAG: MFS transporter [Spirochaetia bacterium]
MHYSAEADTSTLRDVILQRQMLTIFLASLFILVQVLVSFSLVPLYIVERGGGNFAVGLQTTLFTVSSVLLRFVFGPVADQRGRRFALALGAFVFATGHIAIWLSPNLWVMGLARIYQAIGMASYLSAASSFVADLAPQRHRGASIGVYRMVLTAAMMVGPLVGNELIRSYGFDAFFITMSTMSAAAFFLVLTLRNPPVVDGEETGDTTSGNSADRHSTSASEERIRVKDAVRLLAEPSLRAPYLGILIISIAGGIILTYLTLYAEGFVARPALYFTVFALVGAVGALALGALSDRFGRKAVVFPATLILAAGTAVLFFLAEQPLLWLYLSAAMAGFGYNGGLSLFVSWVVDGAEARLRATALALQESGIDTGFGVGIFFFGLLSETWSYAALFLGLGVFVVLGSGLVFAAAPSEKAPVGSSEKGVTKSNE